MVLGQARRMILESRARVGHKVTLACTHCGFLEPDPRILGPSGLVQELTLAAGTLCRLLGACQEILCHSLPEYCGDSMQIMAGKWCSLASSALPY